MAIVITDCDSCDEKITTVGICDNCGTDAARQAVEISAAMSEEFLPSIENL